MRDSGRPVAWDRLSLRLMPGYGSVSKVVRSSSTCSLEKLVLFLRLALREEAPPEAEGLASSEGGEEGRFSRGSATHAHVCALNQEQFGYTNLHITSVAEHWPGLIHAQAQKNERG